jgi:CheY-like chemotaxis protein
VALVDLHIPDTSVHQNPELVGIEIMKKIREQCETWKLPQIPCIAYTAKIDSPTLSEIFAAGATNFIPKGDFKDKNALLLRLREHIKDNVMGAHRSSILRKAAG